MYQTEIIDFRCKTKTIHSCYLITDFSHLNGRLTVFVLFQGQFWSLLRDHGKIKQKIETNEVRTVHNSLNIYDVIGDYCFMDIIAFILTQQ